MNILAIRVGCRSAAIENSDHSEPHVRIYDNISRLQSKTPVKEQFQLLDHFNLYRSNEKDGDSGAAAAGMCRLPDEDDNAYLLAVYNTRNNGRTDFYRTTLSENKSSVEPLFQLGTGSNSYQNIAFFTDASGIYLVSFRCQGSGTSYADYLDIYRVDKSHSISKVMIRHMVTDSEGIVGIAGVHFRWAACMEWERRPEALWRGKKRSCLQSTV